MVNTAKLNGLIAEKGLTKQKLAGLIGGSNSRLGEKISNKAYFTAKEIEKIQKVLDIPNEMIGEIFFAKFKEVNS